VVSAGVGFIPLVGTGKAIVDCWNGVDAISGEEIDGWDYALNLIPIGGAAGSNQVQCVLHSGLAQRSL
jgi:hypothetical protein